MPPQTLVADAEADVNARVAAELADAYAKRVLELLSGADLSGRDGEIAVWAVLLETGPELLTTALSSACHRVTMSETGGRPVRLRLVADYVASQSTTMGEVKVPLFAFRDGGLTRCPAREQIFPLLPKCRSSELLLEWEARLGCQLPFRQAGKRARVLQPRRRSDGRHDHLAAPRRGGRHAGP